TGGNWVITNGVLRQTAIDFNCFVTIGDTNWSNYSLQFQARKISGDEGFSAVVGAHDGSITWANIGSWGNHSVEIYQDMSGRRGTITDRIPFTVESGRWYNVRIDVEGARVSCYVDSNLVCSAIAAVSVTTNAVYLGATATPY